MLQLLLYVLLAIVVAVGLFLLAAFLLPTGEQIAPVVRDEPVWELPPERALHPEDVDAVRLPIALRGYRFAETDVLLDRLAYELRARDAEIARLRAGAVGGFAPDEPVDPSRFAPPAAGPTVTDPAATADPVARTDEQHD